MPLLPQELGRPQEQARTHLPTHHVSPLVAKNRQVAVRLNPIFIGIPDNGLGGRADDQLLLEPGIGIDDHALAVGIVFQPVMGHHGALLGKPLDMMRLLAEKRLRDKQREISVFMPGIFEHLIQRTLHLFPDRITVRFDHHTSANRRILGQSRFYHQIVIPLRIVFVP